MRICCILGSRIRSRRRVGRGVIRAMGDWDSTRCAGRQHRSGTSATVLGRHRRMVYLSKSQRREKPIAQWVSCAYMARARRPRDEYLRAVPAEPAGVAGDATIGIHEYLRPPETRIQRRTSSSGHKAGGKEHAKGYVSRALLCQYTADGPVSWYGARCNDNVEAERKLTKCHKERRWER